MMSPASQFLIQRSDSLTGEDPTFSRGPLTMEVTH